MSDADKLTIERLSAAIKAVETIATNNSQLLAVHYKTSAEDVRALCHLAQAAWYKGCRR